MKNIVVCSDGTGNTAIKGRATNVFKLYEAIDLDGASDGPRQIAFYDDGVGTERLRPRALLGGAVGFGVGRHVRHPQLGSVPRHIRVVPSHVRELCSIGTQSG